MDSIGVALVYGGLLAAVLAATAVIKPWKWFHTRRRALLTLLAGLGTALAGFALPQGESRVPEVVTQLDVYVPAYQFSELHSTDVHASCEQAYADLLAVRPHEIAFFHLLTAIRRLGQGGGPSMIHAPQETPLLETALHTGFLKLSDRPGDEFVMGAIMGPTGPEWSRDRRSPEAFRTFQRRRAAKVAMNFRMQPMGPGACRVFTETRVYATGRAERQAFAVYWRLIYPGSALIRRMWLQAIRRRAEQTASHKL
jgi:hypothetical protein